MIPCLLQQQQQQQQQRFYRNLSPAFQKCRFQRKYKRRNTFTHVITVAVSERHRDLKLWFVNEKVHYNYDTLILNTEIRGQLRMTRFNTGTATGQLKAGQGLVQNVPFNHKVRA